MQVRVCLQDCQSYVYFILWNKVKLIHQSLPPRGLSTFMLMGHLQGFLSLLLPLVLLTWWPTGLEIKRTPQKHFLLPPFILYQTQLES